MSRRLYKARNNIFLDGVCAGVGNYFNIDPTLVRLAWILFSFAGGSGVLAYIICAIIIPREPASPGEKPYDPQYPEQN